MSAYLRIGTLFSVLFLNCALADTPSDLWSLYVEASR